MDLSRATIEKNETINRHAREMAESCAESQQLRDQATRLVDVITS